MADVTSKKKKNQKTTTSKILLDSSFFVGVLAHLHCQSRTLTRIPLLYGNREWGSESKPVQCKHVLHSALSPLGLEFESESVSESVSDNVNEPFHRFT